MLNLRKDVSETLRNLEKGSKIFFRSFNSNNYPLIPDFKVYLGFIEPYTVNDLMDELSRNDKCHSLEDKNLKLNVLSVCRKEVGMVEIFNIYF